VTELVGQRFGRLVVVGDAGLNKYSQRMIRCVCDCGVTKEVLATGLRAGSSKSCGCLYRETRRTSARKHGHCGPENQKAYWVWKSMLARCSKPAHHAYADYGGRGISVCSKWQTFEGFISDVGAPPPGKTLDRIDNDGNYEPGNVQWTTRTAQNRNRRTSVLTIDLVNEIRGRYEHGEGPTSIARRMGLTRENVGAVVRRKTWADIP
jgi:hypothetical protein